MANDHTVPRMYLRRFGWQQRARSRERFVRARVVGQLDRSFSVNIRNVTAVADFYGQPAERMLAGIENDAASVFDALLEDPAGALPGPDRWPLPDVDREALGWWIAAQIVRTVRQRRRLQHLAGTDGSPMEMPQSIRSLAGRNEHLRFIADQLARLTWIICSRPWGLGFSDSCLWTSDVPVVIVNGHDAQNQLLAAEFWDIVMPVDPHRFLILPSLQAREEDPRKRTDHLLKFDGGMGQVVNTLIYEVADSQVFCHEDHDPRPGLRLDGPQMPTPWNGADHHAPSWSINYATLAAGMTVERRWLVEHPKRRSEIR